MSDVEQIIEQFSTNVPGRFQSKLRTGDTETDPVETTLRNADNEPDPRLKDDLLAQAAVMAASRGQMDRADQITYRIQSTSFRKETYQQVFAAGTQYAIMNEQWTQVRQLSQRIEDRMMRADLFVRAGNQLADLKQHGTAIGFLIDAYQLITPVDPSPRKAELFFDIATTMLKSEPSRTFELALSGVTVLNKLETTQKEAQKMRVDVSALLSDKLARQEMEEAFRRLGRADFDRAIQISTELRNVEQRIVAQAASCREVLLHKANATKAAEQTDQK
jgi:hypothetical protein